MKDKIISGSGYLVASSKSIEITSIPESKYYFITDKTLPKEFNRYVVIAVKEDGNINYYTAIYGIGGKDDQTFVLSDDSIGRLYTIDQIEGYFIFDTL